MKSCLMTLQFAFLFPSILGMMDDIYNKYLSLESTESLIARKASVLTVGNLNGEVLMHWMVTKGKLEDVELLTKYAYGVNRATEKERFTPLHLAVMGKNADKVGVLVRGGSNIECITSNDHSTALHLAAKICSPPIAKILVDAKAATGALNKQSYTPIHVAAENGCVQVAQIILNSVGSNKGKELVCMPVKNFVKDGLPPLQLSLINKHEKMAVFLIDSGADVNVQSYNVYYEPNAHWEYKTALQIAVETLQVNMVKKLIEAQAQVQTATTKSKKTALHALAYNYESGNKKGKKNDSMEKEKKLKIRQILNLIMKEGGIPFTLDASGHSVLYMAIESKNELAQEVFFEEILKEITTGEENGPWRKTLSAGINYNSTPLSLTVRESLPDTLASIIRLESINEEFKITKEQADEMMGVFLVNTKEMLINKGRNMVAKSRNFLKFWMTALEDYKRVRKFKIIKTDILESFEIYKKNNVYPFYLVAKNYYPVFKRVVVSGDEALLTASEYQKEVKDFEDSEINQSREELLKELRSEKDIIGKRKFIYEEAVILTLIKNELGWDADMDAMKKIVKTIKPEKL